MPQTPEDDNKKDSNILDPDLTPEEVASVVRATPRIIKMWAANGRIPQQHFYKLLGGREYRFRPSVITFIRNQVAQ